MRGYGGVSCRAHERAPLFVRTRLELEIHMLQVDVPKKLADAKVDDKDLFEVNHQILRLEVAMDD